MTHKRLRKIFIFILILAIVLPGGINTERAEAATLGIVTATELYVRVGPGTQYDNVTVEGEKVILVKDQQVTILDENNGWYHINAIYRNTFVEGYSSGQYISIPQENPPTDTGSEGQKQDDKEDVPEDGYVIETTVYDAVYNYSGVVSAQLLNMRNKAGSTGKAVAVLKEGQPVTIIKSYMRTEELEGEKRNIRWYRVAVELDGEISFGYVMSDYISLDLTEPIGGIVKYGKQVLHKKSTVKSPSIKTSKKKKVKLPKKSEVTISEEIMADGVKWFLVTAGYKGETVSGYVRSDRISLAENATEYTVSRRVRAEEPAEVITEPKNDKPVYEMQGANAVIRDAAALAVKQSADYASDTVKNTQGQPVLLHSGQQIEVIDVNTFDDIVWCYCRFTEAGADYYGYINARYIEGDSSLNLMSNNENTQASELSFEASLDKEGFPESYKAPLIMLHDKYPEWQFKADHTGLYWSDVIKNETEAGKNLIPNTKGVEWKSLESGAYSWKTDSFIVFDGSTWVTASREAVEYYMDPRNFLTENSIFQFEVLAYNPSYQNIEGITNILKNSAMSGQEYEYYGNDGSTRRISYADTFAMAAEYSGVSPFHLASRVKQEVVIGTNAFSNSVTGTVSGHEGLYNFYNIGAYHSTEVGGAIANGLRFAANGSSKEELNRNCLIPWNDRFRSILGGAYYIGYNYINRGQDTIYLQKFNVTPTNTYLHQYMANVEAPYSEGKRVFTAYEDPGSIPIVFSIPVYLDMPEFPCGVPAKKYNPNNWLKTLKVHDINGDKLSLTPTFDYTKNQEYSLIVSGDTEYIKLNASTVSKLANILTDKSVYLTTGLNRVVIQVQAQNGEIRDYIINIVREESAPEEEKTDTTGVTIIDITDTVDKTGADQQEEASPENAAGENSEDTRKEEPPRDEFVPVDTEAGGQT